MSAKARARDKNLSKLGNRMISTVLKNEKIAEKELEKKMKALKDLERKSMVKICETSLDVKYDYRRKRNTQDLEEQFSDDPLNVSLGGERTLRSPSVSRRGSLVPRAAKEDDSKETESSSANQEAPSDATTNPAILINNESKEDAGSEQDPDSRRSSVGSVSGTPSPCASPRSSHPPGEETAINEEESQKLLKVFSQSSRGSQRRRTAPEITDLSPKLLIQLAKSSAEMKRRGSTHDAAAATNSEEQSEATPTTSLHTKRRGSAAIELLRTKAEQEKSEEPASPTLRRRGSAAVANSSADRLNFAAGSPLLHRRGSSASNKNSLSLETNEALLRDKLSVQAPLSPRLKQPLSPLPGGRRGSGMTASLRPHSAQPPSRDPVSEPILPDLKRPQSHSLRRPVRATSALNRPSSLARSTSPLSLENVQGQLQLEDLGTEYDLTRRRGSRPGSARSCYSMPAGGLYNPAARRGSELVSQIDLNTLSPTSPLRKAMQDPQSTLNPAQASPSDYRRHSGTVEALQGRVDDFLKTLAAKGS